MAGVVTALVIAMTPLLLQWAAPAGLDWDELSKISQTYGALSVFFSAAALLGVAASLTFQAHQTKTENEEAQRASHRELILASLDDPDLAVCWDPLPPDISLRGRKQITFVNLIVSSWWVDYRLKRTNDDVVRVMAAGHFRGEAARRHWDVSGANWREYCEALGERRAIRFVTLMHEAYVRAVADGDPVLSASYFAADIDGRT
ncbi:hypothetical protein GCM10023323_00130 [Streptomyces thinghirensis]|uniref:Uncharacterized protein n=2 Tax=Streptomyces thinghirensis TaxID=551547 RepID=A0ABP9ST82_9ACTN